MRTGDILLYSGKGLVPWLIKRLTKSKWSHVVWVLDEETVLESEYNTGGVVRSLLNKYINGKNIAEHRIKIMRIKYISPEKLNLALLEAMNKLGHRYDYLSIWNLAWKYILTYIGIKTRVSAAKRNRDTCVELIALPLFHQANWKCFDFKSVHATTPGDFDTSNKTEEVT